MVRSQEISREAPHFFKKINGVVRKFMSCVGGVCRVLYCIIKPILRNCYGPVVSSRDGQRSRNHLFLAFFCLQNTSPQVHRLGGLSGGPVVSWT